jgi:hypothetical protein
MPQVIDDASGFSGCGALISSFSATVQAARPWTASSIVEPMYARHGKLLSHSL